MALRITGNETKLQGRLKLLYLVPMLIVCWLPGCLIVGWQEMAKERPINVLMGVWRGEKR